MQYREHMDQTTLTDWYDSCVALSSYDNENVIYCDLDRSIFCLLSNFTELQA